MKRRAYRVAGRFITLALAGLADRREDNGERKITPDFREVCGMALVKPRLDIETGEDKPWDLQDRRKTCAQYDD